MKINPPPMTRTDLMPSHRNHRRLRRNHRLANRCGAAAVEFAIVAPVFFLLVIGMIEVGRAMMVQQVLINASRVGARQAVTAGATSSAVQTAVKDYATSVAVPSVDVVCGIRSVGFVLV